MALHAGGEQERFISFCHNIFKQLPAHPACQNDRLIWESCHTANPPCFSNLSRKTTVWIIVSVISAESLQACERL